MERIWYILYQLSKILENLIVTISGRSSVGRVSAFQADCREFESRRPLHKEEAFRSLFFILYLPFISFQDSCDGSFVVSIPMFRAIEADL